MTKKRDHLFGGIVLILIGFWFLLENFGYDLPGIGKMWPAFPLLGGLAMIVSYLRNRADRDPGMLIPGCGTFFVGIFFLVITLGPLRWRDLDEYWPAFPLIFGLAFLATFVFDRAHRPGFLVPALLGILIGTFGFIYTLWGVSYAWLWRAWPAVLIVIGAVLIVRGMLGRFVGIGKTDGP